MSHGIDGRSAGARRWSRIYSEITAAIGGEPRLSMLQVQMARRAATLVVLCENMEAKVASEANSMSAADPSLADCYIRAVGALTRSLRTLGLKPTIGPNGDDGTLEKWLSTKALGRTRKVLKPGVSGL